MTVWPALLPPAGQERDQSDQLACGGGGGGVGETGGDPSYSDWDNIILSLSVTNLMYNIITSKYQTNQ